MERDIDIKVRIDGAPDMIGWSCAHPFPTCH